MRAAALPMGGGEGDGGSRPSPKYVKIVNLVEYFLFCKFGVGWGSGVEDVIAPLRFER